MPQEFFTIDTLATFVGLVAAVTVIVQFTKNVVVKKYFVDRIVQPYAAIVAFILQMFVLYIQANLTIEAIGLAIINAPLIALTAIGAHKVVKDRLG